MSTVESILTTVELLTIPDDRIERELIRGRLREREITRRSRVHASTEAEIVFRLRQWMEANPHSGMQVLSGEVGCVIARDPDTTVGIDVAVFSRDLLEQQPSDTSLVVGVPILAVEILSPSDSHERTHEKIMEYLRVGTQLVWEVDPDFRTIRVHRPNSEPIMFNRTQEISGLGVLDGFAVSVQQLFP